MTPSKYMSAMGKCIYSNLRRPSISKMSAKKKYFTINFIHLIYKDTKYVRFYLFLPINAFIFLTLNPNITFQAHIISSLIHCTGHTVLLKTLHSHFWSDALPYYCDPFWLNTTFILLCLYLLEPMNIYNFLHRWC